MALAIRHASTPTRLELLGRLRAVGPVTTSGRQRLLAAFNETTVAAGSLILRAGARVDHLYLVADGTVTTTSADGALVLAEAGRPVALRELLDGRPLDAGIVAMTDVELWTMGRRDFLAACKDVPGFALGLLDATA